MAVRKATRLISKTGISVFGKNLTKSENKTETKLYAIVAEKEKAYDEDKKNHEDILNKEYHRFGGCRFTDDVKESLFWQGH